MKILLITRYKNDKIINNSEYHKNVCRNPLQLFSTYFNIMFPHKRNSSLITFPTLASATNPLQIYHNNFYCERHQQLSLPSRNYYNKSLARLVYSSASTNAKHA